MKLSSWDDGNVKQYPRDAIVLAGKLCTRMIVSPRANDYYASIWMKF